MIASPPTPKGLDKAIFSGLRWTLIDTFFGDFFSLLARLILARLLTPEAFGLVGMASVFIALVTVINQMGFSEALIQRRKKDITHEHYNSVFWASLAFSFMLFIFMSTIGAQSTANFFNQPELKNIVIALSVPLCLTPFFQIHKARLRRTLNFRALALADATSIFIGSISAIALALAGAGVWSIVAQSFITALASIPVLWMTSNWRPKPKFSLSSIKDIFSFSAYSWATGFVWFLRKNLDYLLIGKILGAHALGIYTLAFLLTDYPRQKITSIVSQVMFPAMSRIQDDTERLRTQYLTATKFTALINLPVLTILMVFAEPIIKIIFGEKWADGIFPLQALAFGNIIFSMAGSPVAVLKAVGKMRLQLMITSIDTLVIAIPALLIGITHAGINGAAIAVVIYHLSSRIMFHLSLKKILLIKHKDLIGSDLPALAGAIAILVTAPLLSPLLDLAMKATIIKGFLILASCILISFAAYLATIYPFVRKDIAQLSGFLIKNRG